MKKKNILFITVDQFRADCLSRLGHTVINTPHLDSLSYDGILYDNAYSNCPACIPARTSIITGIDAHNNNCPYNEYVNKYQRNHGYSENEKNLKKIRATYYGIITNIDHQLGRLFGKLQLYGLWKNTWIVFTSDHGEKLGDHGSFSKASFTEASAKVPFIIKPPSDSESEVERGRIDHSLVELCDIFPTFCDISGAAIPSDVMGKSLVANTQDAKMLRSHIHGQINNVHMFHDGKYKYIYFANDGSELLFDMDVDKTDSFNLSSDKDLCSAMRKKLIVHLMQENNADLVSGELLNRHLEKPSPEKLKANRINEMGLTCCAKRECETFELYADSDTNFG